MLKTSTISMEKIMRAITMTFMWGILFMNINACMPIDLIEPPFEQENFAPMLISATPNQFNGPYNYSELSSNKLIVKIIDLNTSDTLTLGLYVKNVDNQLEVPYERSIIRKATNNESSNEAIFSFELEEKFLDCGLNRVILLVSDRGLKTAGLSGDDGTPYPSEVEILEDEENAYKVKVNVSEWLIRKECTE